MDNLALGVSIVTMLTTGGALAFTICSFKEQLQLNFFADYTKRYQEIILHFPESINEKTFQLDALSNEDKDKTLRYMRAYFDLCSEEYWLHRRGHINDETWSEWKTGIDYALSKPAFKQAWQILRLDTIYYGEFTKMVEKAISL